MFRYRCIRLLLMLAMLSLNTVIALGQTPAARPDRGVNLNTSYSVSEVENISLQNGTRSWTRPILLPNKVIPMTL